MYKTGLNFIIIFGLRTHFSDSKTSGFSTTYDSLDYTKKKEPIDFQDTAFMRRRKKKKKPSKQSKEVKNRMMRSAERKRPSLVLTQSEPEMK